VPRVAGALERPYWRRAWRRAARQPGGLADSYKVISSFLGIIVDLLVVLAKAG